MEIITFIFSCLFCFIFGVGLGIDCSYDRVSKDKNFSWKGKFYKIKEIDIEKEGNNVN